MGCEVSCRTLARGYPLDLEGRLDYSMGKDSAKAREEYHTVFVHLGRLCYNHQAQCRGKV